MEIITLSQAREQGLKRYYTGKSCKHGHIAERKTGDRTCVICNTEKSRRHAENTNQWRKDNAERDKENKRQYYLSHREETKERTNKARLENPEKHRDYGNKYRRSEKGLEQGRNWTENNREKHYATVKDYKSRNPHIVREATRRRQASKLNASVAWADKKKMQAVYMEACDTGNTVDHIIPLQNDIVCGLHNEFNLQVLSASENYSKNNDFDQEAQSIEYFEWVLSYC